MKDTLLLFHFCSSTLPPVVISSAARNLPCTPSSLLLSLKVSHFPLSHIRHYPLLQERSLDFARDDDTGIALSKHIRCTLREINPFPHTVISSAARNLPCTLLFLAPFAKRFPFSALSCFLRRWIPVFCFHTYDIIPSCKKDPSTSLGMTIQE